MENKIYNYVFSYDFEGLSGDNYTNFKVNFLQTLIDNNLIFDINYRVASTITFKSNLESDKIKELLIKLNLSYSKRGILVRYFLAVVDLNSIQSNSNNESIENFDGIIQ